MIQIIIDLKKSGKNLVLRLPPTIVNILHLHVNQKVQMSIGEDKRLIITPVIEEESTLVVKLTQFDPVKY